MATAVRIEGPATVAPGASAQYRLIATFEDGTTGDVSAQAAWSSSNTSILTAGPGGTVQGTSRGEVALTGRYSNRSTHVYVMVLENGTYRVTGRVTESGGGLPGARVEAVAGTGAGLTATTGSSGSYALYGLAGEVQIEARLEGFDNQRQTIMVNGNTTADLVMRPSVAPTDLNGTWRLTLSASKGCVPPVPDDAAARSYSATVVQNGTFLRIELKSPTFPNAADLKLDGLVIDRRLTVFLPFDDFYYATYGIRYYSLVETLGPSRMLAIAGTARGERAGTAVTGTLDGEFALYSGGDGLGVRNRQFSCSRSDHDFRLDRP
ncbi:MAG: carboxypeptidase-like regulatory domain-containing protein [Vicinamibacterales bacterium]